MTQTLSDTTLAGLSAFLASQMGLQFPRERWRDLERGIVAAARQFGFRDPLECIRWLRSAPLTRQQIEILAGFLTVGETYFFRDPRVFEIVQTEILPGLLRSRRGTDQHLRIWSAACSSGEEPYSIAIMLHRLLPDVKQWNLKILATDINPAALHKAMAGVYGKWSFRGTDSGFRALYFAPEADERWRVAEHVRRLVAFQYLNLAEDSYPSLTTGTSAMDIIFCRNVLMYFSPEMARTVVEKLHRSLVDNGWLIVGPADYSKELFAAFEPVNFDVATLYRKRVRECPVTKESAQPVPEEPAGARSEPAQAPRQPRTEPGKGAGVGPEVGTSWEAAVELYRQGRYPQAVALLTELAAWEEMPAQARILLIRSHANQGTLSEALALCDRALGADKLDPALHYLLAEILQEQGRFEEARDSLKRALYLDPKLVLAHFALGNLTLWRGEAAQARKHFDNALALLRAFAPDDILPGSEGMTAGRLREIIMPMTTGPVESRQRRQP